MNFRYIIKTLSARKIIEILIAKKHTENQIPMILNKESKALVLKLSTIEENALFYQLSRTLYELDKKIEDFDKDRQAYQSNHMPTMNKINDLLSDVIVYVDFTGIFTVKNYVKKEQYHSYAKMIFEHGVIIELDTDKKIHYVPFLKSGSMGRKSLISFVRKDLKNIIDERLNFDLIHESNKYLISKLQAYQGLYLSSGMRIELQELDDESVIVVNDYNKLSVTDNFTTAFSRSIIREMIYDMFFSDEEGYTRIMNTLHTALINNARNIETYSKNQYFNMYEKYRDLREAIQIDLSVYKSLPPNPLNALDTITLEAYNNLILQIFKLLDLEKLKDDDELVVFNKVNINTATNMFDGEGFIDKSFLEYINQTFLSKKQPPYHYSIQFRLPFTKGVLHAVNLVQWFNENNITHIRDAFGNLRNVENIKIILTKSQFKCFNWIKSRYLNVEDKINPLLPMQKYFELFYKYHHALYITNLDQQETEDFETILNYQVLHTPALKRLDFIKLLNRGKENYLDIVSNPDKQIEYFIRSKNYYDSNNEFQSSNDEQSLLIGLLSKNPDFIYDDIYQNRINSYANTLLKNMKTGRIQIEGTVRFLSGDLLELLNQITKGGIYAQGFSDLSDYFYAPSKFNHFIELKNYSILRNPHITSKELVSAKPIPKELNEQREKYFSHLTGVIMLNAFSNQMLAMQTADTDGDIVRIISNDIYNDAVKKSNILNRNQILWFPSLKGEEKHPTNENLFTSTINSFSTRIGLMSNHSFSHSIFAYNENDSDYKKKEMHRRKAEKMSFIIGAEIDAVKSGKAPFYKAQSINNPFIDYKTRVENNRNENINFYIKDNSPNLYYLKENADKVLLEAINAKKLLNKKHSNIIRFSFEKDENWKKSLNFKLLKEISKLLLSYLDFNRQLGYIMQPNSYFNSKIQSTIQYILSLQYDDITMTLTLDNLLIKLIAMDIEQLVSIRDLSLSNHWQFISLQQKKEALLSKYFGEILNEEEIELLTNFSNNGHKLLYLILSEAILTLEKELSVNLNGFDTISRYKILLKNIFDRHNIHTTDNLGSLIHDALINRLSDTDLIIKYIDKTSILGTSDYEKACSYTKKIKSSIKKLPKKEMAYTLEDLDDISTLVSDCNNRMYDKQSILLPIWKIRLNVERYFNDSLDKLFKYHGVSRDVETMYYYALRTYDKSMKFMFTFARNTILNLVIDLNKEDISDVKRI
ncbi:hypothetical protein [Mariniplasma anaerobium]|uniref:Uncharacterized protein n=1 Tax=Mariniplasma anaerobium TaxID=2735436 RepID=A0A7U9THK3_9MOLU|nr:hypothetical protein [Mariniplasma anaerobium]BCR35184.1 hypothetical protein MPAN_000770 [Mariniplasma anaerobium]